MVSFARPGLYHFFPSTKRESGFRRSKSSARFPCYFSWLALWFCFCGSTMRMRGCWPFCSAVSSRLRISRTPWRSILDCGSLLLPIVPSSTVCSAPSSISSSRFFRCGPREEDIEEGAEQTVEDGTIRSEEHTSELQSLTNLVCRLLL